MPSGNLQMHVKTFRPCSMKSHSTKALKQSRQHKITRELPNVVTSISPNKNTLFFPQFRAKKWVTKDLMISVINDTILLISVFLQGITRGVKSPAILFDQAVSQGSWSVFLVHGCCALQCSQSAFPQGIRWYLEAPDLPHTAAGCGLTSGPCPVPSPFSQHIVLGSGVKWWGRDLG